MLLNATLQHDVLIRDAALKALNRLRTTAAHLHFERGFVAPQIMTEARTYFELSAAPAPVANGSQRQYTRLLTRSIEERKRKTLGRIFRRLALQYPPKEIHAAWLAVDLGLTGEISAAIEFLDNVVDREVKRVLMPLVEAPVNMAQRGKELFGVEVRGAAAAIHELSLSGDPWLAPCARAAAVEFGAAGEASA